MWYMGRSPYRGGDTGKPGVSRVSVLDIHVGLTLTSSHEGVTILLSAGVRKPFSGHKKTPTWAGISMRLAGLSCYPQYDQSLRQSSGRVPSVGCHLSVRLGKPPFVIGDRLAHRASPRFRGPVIRMVVSDRSRCQAWTCIEPSVLPGAVAPGSSQTVTHRVTIVSQWEKLGAG